MLVKGAARADKKPLVRSGWSGTGHGVREPACGQAAKAVKRVGGKTLAKSLRGVRLRRATKQSPDSRLLRLAAMKISPHPDLD